MERDIHLGGSLKNNEISVLYKIQKKSTETTVKRLKLTIIILLLTLSSTLSFAWASDPIVQLNGDQFTLSVTDQSLSTILEKLSDQGIHIRIDPRINPKITAAFTKRPIGAAMNTILRSVNYALIWKQNEVSESDPPRLQEIRIFYKGQEGRIRPLIKNVQQTVAKKTARTFYRKDILLLQLAPSMTKDALEDLVAQLGATIIDTHAPLGIVQLRLPPGSDVQTIAKSLAAYPEIQDAEPDYAYPLEGGSPIPVARERSSPSQSVQVSPANGTTVAVLESATQYATANGLVLVAAAGNTPTGKPVYPAAYENVIAVGALAPDGERWDQSNYGDFVDIQAPGFAYMPVGYQGDAGLYAGTSIDPRSNCNTCRVNHPF